MRWLWVLAVVLFVALLTWRASLGNPLEMERAKLHEQGFLSTWNEVIAFSPTEGQDAGSGYRSYDLAVENIKDPAVAKAFEDLDHHIPPAQEEQDVQVIRPLLAQLIEASKKPRWAILDEGHRFDPGGKAARGPYLLCVLARSDAHRGHPEMALNDLRAAARMCHQMWSNPGMYCAWGGIGREIVVLQTLNIVMSSKQNDPKFVQEGIDFVKTLPPLPNLRRSLEAECVRYLDDFQKQSTLEAWHDPDAPVTIVDRAKDIFWEGPHERKREAYVIRLRREALERLPRDPMDWEESAHAYQSVANDHMDDPFSLEFPTGTEAVASTFIHVWGTDCAYRVVELAALQTQLERLQGGAPSPSRLIDPYSHNRLLFRDHGAVFVDYSVGPDRVDNGGKGLESDPWRMDIVAGYGKSWPWK